MKCREVREMIPAFADGSEPTLAFRRHVARCSGCAAEFAAYERVVESLSSLREVTLDPPPGLLRTLQRIPAPTRPAMIKAHVARNRRAYVGGVALALVGLAGTTYWRGRGRRIATA